MSDYLIPSHFDRSRVSEVWRVAYETRAADAALWAGTNKIPAASEDDVRVALLLVDCQNTFCIPGYELYVGGQSGNGAVEDNIRLCEFIYRNIGSITEIIPTLDTHTALQIFHPVFWVDSDGQHPRGGGTVIGREDLENEVWRVNPAVAKAIGRDLAWLREYAVHYVTKLEAGRSPLMVWPYHAMLGGIGHALVSSVDEAVFFHGIARKANTRFEIKGRNALTENYSALSPEVTEDQSGERIAGNNRSLLERLSGFDRVIVAGQAKSHCVAWSVQDLIDEFRIRDEKEVSQIQILEDCTSPVVVPGVVDFTDSADDVFRGFREDGVEIVPSSVSISR